MSAITRSIQVMDLLSRKGPLGVRAIAQALGLPLGSTHRMLLDLAEENVVERTDSGEWELSFRLLQISGLQLDRIALPRLARPYAKRIAAATQETVNVTALSGGVGVCIDKVRGNEGMQLDMRIGSRGPLHCGGGGKAMLAYMTETEREEVYRSQLDSFTPRTLSDPAALRAEIARIRGRGYSIDDQEVVMGVWCVAVPILDRSAYPAGALSITGPSLKEPGPGVVPLVDMLNEACEAISRRLGYRGDWPPVEKPAPARAAAG